MMNIDAKIFNKILANHCNSTSKSLSITINRLHSRDARLVQHTQVYKGNLPHKQNQRQKPHDYLNRCREGLSQNSTAFHAKKTLNKLGVDRIHLKTIKSIYYKPTANIILNG